MINEYHDKTNEGINKVTDNIKYTKLNNLNVGSFSGE